MKTRVVTPLLRPFPGLSPAGRVLVALLPTAAVLLGRPLLPQVLHQTPAAMHYPAVLLAAWIGGLWPGLVSTVACSVISATVLRPQLLQAPLSDPQGLIRSLMFFYTSIIFTLMISGLQRALLRAENAIRMRDEFLSLASHELKTPLATLLLQGQVRLRRTLVRDTARIYQEQEGHTLELEFCEPLEVDADPMLLEQVVTNLLSNAAKYAKGTTVRLSVSRLDAAWARVQVADQGPGIAPENHERIFKKFERANTSEHTAGLGLGLYICQEVARRHNGRLLVKSEPGQGAAFSLLLPLPTQPQ